METLFVTGGTGFIGSAFVDQAVNASYRVQALTRSEAGAERLRSAGAEPVLGDPIESVGWETAAAGYDPGSWFVEYNLAPLHAGKTVTRLGGRSRVVSTVHVNDVARAILHLLDRGQAGERYFVVDDEPGPALRLARGAAQALGVPLKV